MYWTREYHTLLGDPLAFATVTLLAAFTSALLTVAGDRLG